MIYRILLLTSIILPSGSYGQELDDMLDLSLEDLMNIEITSVSKKAERLQDVASSIYVLTEEDIRNSNATTLHEALRLVPGYWGVQDEYSSVSSNVRYSQIENALTGTVLYLLDGTPIQDQMFSGFRSRNFDIPLDEIERIEVIRGSGGTIYGANSATGVINIFTKDPTKYDGISVRGEVASGGYVNTTFRAGGKVSEKLALSGYGKVRLFEGFGSLAGTDENGNRILASSRFEEDYDAMDMFSFGFKGNFEASENTVLSFRSHFNTLSSYDYANTFSNDFVFTGNDVLYGEDINSNRFVGNVRLDQQLSENHSFFARISSNTEKNYLRPNGGYYVNNKMYDFEIQDNLAIGNNNLSFGFNYRFIDFDISDINDPSSIDYLDKQANESLIGFFAQDKISFSDGKFNLILGIKGETYSLINKTFYFSPVAKISFVPSENMTIWGGFTQSYSTPGFTNTNLDLAIFQTPTIESWTLAATQGVFLEVYNGAIAQGADDATATAQANAFLSSPAGQGLVQTTAEGLLASNPNIYVKNGSNTVPTRLQTFELGFRATIRNVVNFESNWYYTEIADGIGATPPSAALPDQPSPTDPNRRATYFFYGNYGEGTIFGAETSVKVVPSAGVNFELSHSLTKSDWSLQENPDFEITGDEDINLDPAIVPIHVIRFKSNIAIADNFNVSTSLIYGTEFNTQGDFGAGNYVIEKERYRNLVIAEDGVAMIAPNDDRLIVNLRIEKNWMNNRLSTFVFGNDLFNDGIEANQASVFNVTRSQIARMIGGGFTYKFN